MTLAAASAAPRWCPRCERGVAPERCRAVELGSQPALLCGTCGSVTRGVEVAEARALGPLYLDALRYPATRDGVIALVALGAGAWVLGHFPFLGALLSLGVVATWLLAVVRHTAAGRDGPPPPEDFVHWTDILAPLARMAAALLVAALPLAGAFALAPALPAAARVALGALAAAVSIAWVPGAVATAAFAGGVVRALSPVPTLALVTRIPRDYALTVAALWALAPAGLAVAAAAAATSHALRVVPALPSVAAWAASLYVPAVMARVLGVLLRERRMEIGLDD